MKIVFELSDVSELIRLKELLSKISPKDFDVSLCDFDLPIRTLNALGAAGITTVSDVNRKDDRELALIPNLGRMGLNELRGALKARGFDGV